MKNTSFKRIVSLLLCMVMVLAICASAVSCGGGTEGGGSGGGGGGGGSTQVQGNKNPRPDHSNYTTIQVDCYLGGVGVQWLYDAATRFQEAYADYEFEPGKKGIYVDIYTAEPQSEMLDSVNYNIIFDERHSDVYQLAANNKILDITDVLTSTALGESIESRIDAATLEGLKGPDGKYYALPNYEIYPGLTYDRDAFREKNWYIAKDAENGVACKSTRFGTLYFVKNDSSVKSAGPDCVYGTDDDGLPASVEELIILCDNISRDGIPFTLSGQWTQYANYLVQGIWTSLAGYDEIQALYNYDGTHKVEVVTGISNDNLFTGIDYVKKPITETVTITEDNGYLAYSSAARYYAAAFVKIAQQEGWFSSESTDSTSHLEAMGEFIMSSVDGTRRAFLIEGSYWYNESSEESDELEMYTKLTDNEYIDLAWMSLPMSLKTEDVVVGTKKTQTLMDNGITRVYINAKFKDNTNIIDACKKFLEFSYSDAENKEFTKVTGVLRPMDYELSAAEVAELPLFQRSVYNLVKESNVLYNSSASSIFKKNESALQVSFSRPIFRPNGEKSYFDAFRLGRTLEEVFNITKVTEDAWKAYKAK